MAEYFHKGYDKPQKQLQNVMEYRWMDTVAMPNDEIPEKLEFVTNFEKMNHKINEIDYQKEEPENTFVSDESKKGFIFGLCLSLMNEAIEKGSSVKLATNLTKNMIRKTLTSLDLNFNEKEFQEFINFNEHLSNHGSSLTSE